jgi:hypothetical protein
MDTKLLPNNTSYNENRYVRESHNCYSYFLNLKSNGAYELCKTELNNNDYCKRSQPGYASGHPRLKTDDFNCPNIMKRTLDDNKYIFKIDKKKTCPTGYYKGALVVAPRRDYHYYRQNDDGSWLHKPGYKPVQHADSNGNIITDPETAARDYGGTLNYTDFCGFLCVPRDPTKKKMDMTPNPALAPMKAELTNEIKQIVRKRRNATRKITRKYKNKR